MVEQTKEVSLSDLIERGKTEHGLNTEQIEGALLVRRLIKDIDQMCAVFCNFFDDLRREPDWGKHSVEDYLSHQEYQESYLGATLPLIDSPLPDNLVISERLARTRLFQMIMTTYYAYKFHEALSAYRADIIRTKMTDTFEPWNLPQYGEAIGWLKGRLEKNGVGGTSPNSKAAE